MLRAWKNRRFPHAGRRPRRAAILLTVLVVIALITVGAAAYFDWTFTERRATRTYSRAAQARLAAESGLDLLRVMLAQDRDQIEADGGLIDNPDRFRGVLLADSDAAALRCRISVLAPNVDDGEYAGWRFGLENESARLNLNTLLALDAISDTAARDRLMGLPGMTESIADAILDWLDPDSETRQFGAELTYYSTLDPGYAPQNGPLESIEQLLLVRDVTPELLYGLDANRDFLVDGREATHELPADVANTDGEMNRGWAAYLTLYSAERETNPEGLPKINVNSDDLRTLHGEIEQAIGLAEANFIIAFRQGGAADGGGGGNQSTVAAESVQIDFEAPAAVKIDNLLRLVGADVDVVQSGENERQTIAAIFPSEPQQTAGYLPGLLDYLTVYESEAVPGRLNINQAPRALVASVPGMPPEAVESILGNRGFEGGSVRIERRHATWMLSEGYVTLEEMRQMMPLVTAGGDVYRAQVYGFYDEEGPHQRVEAVIDATVDTPTILFKQDLSPLGGGPTAAELGAEQLVEEASPSGL